MKKNHRTLTIEERVELESLRVARLRQAVFATVFALVLTVGAVLRTWIGLGATPSDAAILLVLSSGSVAALLLFGSWLFGWRLVARLAHDLRRNEADLVSGRIMRVDRERNAYGELTTYVTIGERRLCSRGKHFDSMDRGDVAEVIIAKESQVVVGARHARTSLSYFAW